MVKEKYKNWYGARSDCLKYFADLTSITTLAEQEFITKELMRGDYVWLGLSDAGKEGNWSWVDK